MATTNKKKHEDFSEEVVSVNVHEAKTHLSRLLRAVESGRQQITICRDGKVIARIVPAESTKAVLTQHPDLRRVRILEDPSLPASESDWPTEYR